MRPRFILNLLAGVFFVCALLFFPANEVCAQNRSVSPAENLAGIQDTQKIKIISAFCIDGKWSFNIYDGVKNKTSLVVLGRRNSDGIIVESFDEPSQTAVVSTPRGRFRIVMQTASSSAAETEDASKNQPQPELQDSGTEAKPSAKNQKVMTRRDMLNLIK